MNGRVAVREQFAVKKTLWLLLHLFITFTFSPNRLILYILLKLEANPMNVKASSFRKEEILRKNNNYSKSSSKF